MIRSLKPLGSTPSFDVCGDWDVVRLCQIARARSDKNRPELGLLSVFLGRGVIPYSEGGGQVHKPGLDLANYQAVHPGDLVLNNQQAWRGSVGVSSHLGLVSPAYLVLSLDDVLDRSFANYLFQSRVMVAQFVTSSKGVGDIQRDIHTPWLRNTRVPIPPRNEQAAIARFLAYVDQRIRRSMRLKQQLIKLLEEQKQAIIHRAVTRGVDPEVSLKASGADWLGDVPEHWETRRIANLFSQRVETGEPELPILIVSIANGVARSADENGDGRPKRFIEDRGRYKVARRGDIVYNTMRMWQGAVGVAPEDGLVSPAYVVSRPHVGVASEYYCLLFRTDACKCATVSLSRGIVDDRNRLYWDGFKVLQVPVPSQDEQRRIVETVATQTRTIRHPSAHVLREIALLREFRTCMITDVVTGKLDVRAAAASLPDKAGDSDLLDEAEALHESDEGVAEADLVVPSNNADA